MSFSQSSGESVIPPALPRHVAVIMDGNGRWAQKRLLSRIFGHEKGAEAVRAVVRTCRELGIPFLTLYAFSTENWQRPQMEIDALMGLLRRFVDAEGAELIEKNIRLKVIGTIERLPADLQASLRRLMGDTAANSALQLNLALSYGGRDEITRAARAIARRVQAGTLNPESITEETLADHLDTRGIPDPDILIRTGGEMRISNFLLWQAAYAEIFVTPTLWPDFGRESLLRVFEEFQQRERRFGRV
ncbi:MAG: isoprenyl transferase [Desulfobacterales bacterium]|nr:isoprenyl transferase [Desulfobacterales bacterium]